jgi:asparagine synthase (glutamine-hydrolysing)
MSGLFGLIDPGGVDARALQRAADAAAYRGKAEVFAEGPIAVGVMARAHDRTVVYRTPNSDLVIDGRIDAVMTRVQVEGGPPIATIDHLLATDPEHLSMVAAEFALARVDREPGTLMLARDAFGLHPLYYAVVGRRFGFASDPAILFQMGVATEELDPEVITDYLARSEPTDGRTAFSTVRELLPGHLLTVDLEGRRSSGQWFSPERLKMPTLGRDEAVEAVREAVGAAIASRTDGARVGVSLSGGRDSSSLAIAAANQGIDVTCLTQTFDPDLPVTEEHLARQVAERSGLRWLPAPVTSSPSDAELSALPRWTGTPLGPFGFPQSTAVVDAAGAAGLDVVLLGEGGEPMFAASDLAVLDLARTGHPLDAAKVVRRNHDVWGHAYSRSFKVAARAMLPRSILRMRERARPVPPWVDGMIGRDVGTDLLLRTDRGALLDSLLRPQPSGYDLEERLYQTHGLRPEYPFLDLRVVAIALALRLVDRAPIRQPKPILAEAFLGELAPSRVKMSFLPYYERLAGRVQRDHPDLFARDSLSCKLGLIRGSGLSRVNDPAWITDSLGLVALETWLREAI